MTFMTSNFFSSYIHSIILSVNFSTIHILSKRNYILLSPQNYTFHPFVMTVIPHTYGFCKKKKSQKTFELEKCDFRDSKDICLPVLFQFIGGSRLSLEPGERLTELTSYFLCCLSAARICRAGAGAGLVSDCGGAVAVKKYKIFFHTGQSILLHSYRNFLASRVSLGHCLRAPNDVFCKKCEVIGNPNVIFAFIN